MRYSNPTNYTGFLHRQERRQRREFQIRKEQLAAESEIQALAQQITQQTNPRTQEAPRA